ncbi:MAG: EthD domain-containing protein [Gemmatimonadaceae bacterium]
MSGTVFEISERELANPDRYEPAGYKRISAVLASGRQAWCTLTREFTGAYVVKVVYCICRKPGISRQEFIRYWADVHGPIGARIPGLRRFVQSYAIVAPGDARPSDFDGMVELWFDDLAALLEARQSSAWAASTADEVNFLDPARSAYFVCEEREIL